MAHILPSVVQYYASSNVTEQKPTLGQGAGTPVSDAQTVKNHAKAETARQQ